MYIDIVFDKPPGPDGCTFIEVENEIGRSFSLGYWVKREDGLWALRVENIEAEKLAKEFHQICGRFVPEFKYKTQIPWESVPEKNGQLMIAVCEELLKNFIIKKKNA